MSHVYWGIGCLLCVIRFHCSIRYLVFWLPDNTHSQENQWFPWTDATLYILILKYILIYLQKINVLNKDWWSNCPWNTYIMNNMTNFLLNCPVTWFSIKYSYVNVLSIAKKSYVTRSLTWRNNNLSLTSRFALL